MSIFGAIVGGPIGVVLGDKISGGETVVGTGPALPTDPPPFTGQGTSGDDVVRISRSTVATLGEPLYDVEINGQHYTVSKEELESTVFDLGGGDDLDGGSGSNTVLRNFADFASPFEIRNPKLFFDYADVASSASNRDAELSRG